MTDDLALALERVRQVRDALDRAFGVTRAPRGTNPAAMPGPFRRGDRVFDTVSGLEGEIIHASRETVIRPAAK